MNIQELNEVDTEIRNYTRKIESLTNNIEHLKQLRKLAHNDATDAFQRVFGKYETYYSGSSHVKEAVKDSLYDLIKVAILKLEVELWQLKVSRRELKLRLDNFFGKGADYEH